MIEPLKDYEVAAVLPKAPFWRMAGKPGFGDVTIAHIHLITAAQFRALDKGTILYSIMGERVIVGEDNIDTDTRAGLMAFGKLCIFDACVKEES
jgi:hypothetical protein